MCILFCSLLITSGIKSELLSLICGGFNQTGSNLLLEPHLLSDCIRCLHCPGPLHMLILLSHCQESLGIPYPENICHSERSHEDITFCVKYSLITSDPTGKVIEGTEIPSHFPPTFSCWTVVLFANTESTWRIGAVSSSSSLLKITRFPHCEESILFSSLLAGTPCRFLWLDVPIPPVFRCGSAPGRRAQLSSPLHPLLQGDHQVLSL